MKKAGWILRVCGADRRGRRVTALIELKTRAACREWSRRVKVNGVENIEKIDQKRRRRSVLHIAPEKITRVHYFRRGAKA